MKYVFLGCLLVLVLASLFRAWMSPEARSDVPVLYWLTDRNPARLQQVNRFHEWLAKNNHPRFELRLDTATKEDNFKKIIQGVSGVGADIMDTQSMDMPYFWAMGLLADLSDDAAKMGFDGGRTYASVRPLIELDGRQYRFPCNVTVDLYWINKATFAKHGLSTPPRVWDLDTFEKIGKQFIRAANAPGKRQTVFFADSVSVNVLRRSLGLDVFNETLTRCTLDDPRHVQVLGRVAKWMKEDRILPAAQDVASFATESGFGGATPQLFRGGQYGMFRMGRHALIQLREFGSLELSVSEPPFGDFGNTTIETRAAAVYAGSKHRELAKLFLAFLASEDYNMGIVEDGDGLPPNPRFTELEAFRGPEAHANEWSCHAAFAEAAQSIAIAESTSPFVLPLLVWRADRQAYEAFMNGRVSAEEAAQRCARVINEEIQRTLQENPQLVEKYHELVRQQEMIDECRAAGQKVPLNLIRNTFHRRYYQFKGWAQ